MADLDHPLLWARTVGAPTPEDPRNGEMHQILGTTPPKRWSLEPWDGQGDGDDAFYELASDSPELDDEGRSVWIYRYVPSEE